MKFCKYYSFFAKKKKPNLVNTSLLWTNKASTINHWNKCETKNNYRNDHGNIHFALFSIQVCVLCKSFVYQLNELTSSGIEFNFAKTLWSMMIQASWSKRLTWCVSNKFTFRWCDGKMYHYIFIYILRCVAFPFVTRFM